MKTKYTLRQKENFSKLLEHPKLSPALKKEWDAGNFGSVLSALKEDEAILKQISPRIASMVNSYINTDDTGVV
jgi:hypothetical protein